jgi:hypothetical protein
MITYTGPTGVQTIKRDARETRSYLRALKSATRIRDIANSTAPARGRGDHHQSE